MVQSSGASPGPSGGTAKTAVRDRLLTARRQAGPAALAEATRARTTHLLARPEVGRAATVAAYVSVGSEPGTTELIEVMHARGTRVLLPLLAADGDLDWAAYAGPGSLAPAARGLLEPTGPSLGRDAIARADLVLVPGLAVGADGTRLGRGGGSYDRALARVPLGTPVWVLLGDAELLDVVPAEPHDRPVGAAVTESGHHALPR